MILFNLAAYSILNNVLHKNATKRQVESQTGTAQAQNPAIRLACSTQVRSGVVCDNSDPDIHCLSCVSMRLLYRFRHPIPWWLAPGLTPFLLLSRPGFPSPYPQKPSMYWATLRASRPQARMARDQVCSSCSLPRIPSRQIDPAISGKPAMPSPIPSCFPIQPQMESAHAALLYVPALQAQP
jgi:hypothetical protein